jgi:hypothetical protein
MEQRPLVAEHPREPLRQRHPRVQLR